MGADQIRDLSKAQRLASSGPTRDIRRNMTAMVVPIAAGESQEDGETPRRFV
jgi:hypothetical protein